MSENLQCPVSPLRTDENVVRIIAFQVVLLTLLSIWASNPFLFLFLFFDFSIRAFTDGKWSILRQIGMQLSSLLKLKKKVIPAEPKKFAALLGSIFSIVVSGFYFMHFEIAASSIGLILVLCAVLESFLGICIGCHFYTFLQFIKVGIFNQKTV